MGAAVRCSAGTRPAAGTVTEWARRTGAAGSARGPRGPSIPPYLPNPSLPLFSIYLTRYVGVTAAFGPEGRHGGGAGACTSAGTGTSGRSQRRQLLPSPLSYPARPSLHFLRNCGNSGTAATHAIGTPGAAVVAWDRYGGGGTVVVPTARPRRTWRRGRIEVAACRQQCSAGTLPAAQIVASVDRQLLASNARRRLRRQ